MEEMKRSPRIWMLSAVAGMAAAAGLFKGPLGLSEMPISRADRDIGIRPSRRPNRNRCINKHPGVRNPKIAAQVNMMHEKWLSARAARHAE